MTQKPETVDEYMAALSDDKREALTTLRRIISAAVPEAEECISYGIPTFRLDGRMLAAFAAFARHCSFFPGASPIEVHKRELEAYRTSRGTIRFRADKPLPGSLVRRLVRTRIAEIARSKRAQRRVS